MNSISQSDNTPVDFNMHKYVEEGVISMIPTEVFKQILSYLNNKEILSANLVSHFWNKTSLDVVKMDEYSCRNDFIDFLIENIKDANREKELTSIKDDSNIFTMKNLKAVKLSSETSVELITRILSGVNDTKLNDLRRLCRMRTRSIFNNLLAVADLYKDLDRVKEVSDRLCKVDKLQRVSMLLTAYRKIDKAVAVAYIIPDDCERSLTIQGISEALMQFGKIEKAIYVASLIPKDYIRAETYDKLILLLFKRGAVKRAVEVAKLMPDYVYQSHALSKIAELLIAEGKQEEATDLTTGITHSYVRASTLKLCLQNSTA